MNSCSRIAFLAFLSFFFACTEKEAAVQPLPGEFSFTARFVGNAEETRTLLGADLTTVLWMPHETVSMFNSGEMTMFTSDNSEKAAVVRFSGKFGNGGRDSYCGPRRHSDGDASFLGSPIRNFG